MAAMTISAVRGVGDTDGVPEEAAVEEAAAVVAEAVVAEAEEVVFGQTVALDAYRNKRTAAHAPWVADVDSCVRYAWYFQHLTQALHPFIQCFLQTYYAYAAISEDIFAILLAHLG